MAMEEWFIVTMLFGSNMYSSTGIICTCSNETKFNAVSSFEFWTDMSNNTCVSFHTVIVSV